MAILNNKGQLFGKINIIDLIIILVIVAVIGGGIYKFSTLDNIFSSDNLKEVSLVLEVPEVNEGLIASIEKGDVLYDSVRGSEFGTVTSKGFVPHKELVTDIKGIAEYKEIPELYDVELQIKSLGNITNNGTIIGSTPIYIGSSIRLRSSLYVFTSDVLNIEIDDF